MLPLAQWTQKTDSCLMQTMFDQHVMMSPVSQTMQQNLLTNFRSPIVKRKITLVLFYVREEQGFVKSKDIRWQKFGLCSLIIFNILFLLQSWASFFNYQGIS